VALSQHWRSSKQEISVTKITKICWPYYQLHQRQRVEGNHCRQSQGGSLQHFSSRQWWVTTTAACKKLSESSSSGRGADDDDEEITGTGEENIEGIDEEEEEENPLPGTQEPEQVPDEDSEAGQQSHQQSEDEEQSGEDEVEDTEEEAEDTAMAKDCDMSPGLQFWYGNSKDRTSIEWWCEAVDRIKDQKGWNNDQGKKVGVNDCADGTQAILFVAGLLPYLTSRCPSCAFGRL
jgi:hypothetical protein